MVTSINKDIVAHTATVHGGFDVAIETHTSASLVLTKAGIVEYYCRFHPNMKGRITITPPYGVREYFYSYPFSRSEECRLVAQLRSVSVRWACPVVGVHRTSAARIAQPEVWKF